MNQKCFQKIVIEKKIIERLFQRFGDIKALKEEQIYITPGNYDFFAHHGPGFILRAMNWLKDIISQTNNK